jgi:hypothetical protein
VTPAPKQPASAPPAASAASPDPTIKSGKAAGALASATTAGVGPSVVAFDKDTYVATESEGVVKLTVKRTGSTRHAARFEWTLIPNSAAAGDDFAAIGPGMETIAAGHSSATLAIPLVSDAIREPTELFLVELVAVDDSARVGDQARAAVIVVDDD